MAYWILYKFSPKAPVKNWSVFLNRIRYTEDNGIHMYSTLETPGLMRLDYKVKDDIGGVHREAAISQLKAGNGLAILFLCEEIGIIGLNIVAIKEIHIVDKHNKIKPIITDDIQVSLLKQEIIDSLPSNVPVTPINEDIGSSSHLAPDSPLRKKLSHEENAENCECFTITPARSHGKFAENLSPRALGRIKMDLFPSPKDEGSSATVEDKGSSTTVEEPKAKNAESKERKALSVGAQEIIDWVMRYNFSYCFQNLSVIERVKGKSFEKISDCYFKLNSEENNIFEVKLLPEVAFKVIVFCKELMKRADRSLKKSDLISFKEYQEKIKALVGDFSSKLEDYTSRKTKDSIKNQAKIKDFQDRLAFYSQLLKKLEELKIENVHVAEKPLHPNERKRLTARGSL